MKVPHLPALLSVRPMPHRLHIQLTHDSPAYLNEKYPITIQVSNIDERELDITIDVLLQPPEDDESGERTTDYITYDVVNPSTY
jgi:hypothetical protein